MQKSQRKFVEIYILNNLEKFAITFEFLYLKRKYFIIFVH